LEAGPRFRGITMDGDGGNGANVDLIVHQVRVTPIAAHVGDTIQFDMVLENHGDNVKTTISLEIYANGKVVASKLFTFGWGGEPGKIYRERLEWNTRGASPGEYQIKGEAFVWDDQSQFDNFLKVKEPLLLLQEGVALPAGKEDGGSAVAVQYPSRKIQ
jgi:hypothetical protein